MRATAPSLVLLGALVAAPALGDEGWTFRHATLSKGDFRFKLTGYVQGDFRSFRNWEAGDEDTGLLHSEPSELRRLRMGFEARWGRLSLELDVDPRSDEDHLKDAYADLRIAKGLRVRGGHFKLPVSGEFLTSAAKTDFIERALLATHVGPARDWGVMVHGEPWKWLVYQAGIFKGDGRTRHDRAETTVVGRLVVTPIDDLDLAASYSQGDVEAQPAGPGLDPRPKGFLGEGPTGFQFYGRHFVNGRRRRGGLEIAFSPGPVRLRAQLLQGREERKGQGSILDDLPEEVATGWAVSGTWLVTGEKKRRSLKLKRPLFRGPGAVELGVRYEELRFDDDGPDAGFAGAGNRARNIRPAADRALTGGVSWWPVRWIRLMGNVAVERYGDALLAPEPGRRGSYVTLLGRAQIEVP